MYKELLVKLPKRLSLFISISNLNKTNPLISRVFEPFCTVTYNAEDSVRSILPNYIDTVLPDYRNIYIRRIVKD